MVRGPVGSMGYGWPYYHRFQTLTVRTYALDGSHRRSLDTRASSPVVLADKDFDGT